MNHDDPLNTEACYVRGAGPYRGELLSHLDLKSVGDLLFFLPREILDLTHVKRPRDLSGGAVESVRGRLADRDARSISRGRTLTVLLLDCGEGEYVRGSWFNQPWIIKRYQSNELLLFSGKAKFRAGRWEFGNPQVKVLADDESADGGIQPIYRLTEGLTQDQMRKICRAAVEDYVDYVPDSLPESLQARWKLPDLRAAIRGLHMPQTVAEYEKGRHRVLFDDLFEFQLGMAMRRRRWRAEDRAPSLAVTAKIDSRIRRLFPFNFTPGQDKAVAQIARDLATRQAMHRLLQADVGAGKTVVAIYAMLTAIAHGFQAAVMAPTEVLANQHWRTIDSLLARSRVRRELLTGRLTQAERRRLRERITRGEVDLVVGTQALIQEGVDFPKLGVVVIDEQHKFGVAQRGHFSLQNDGDEAMRPHVLVMTATPIPRTLCLTTFGDLDVTRITDLPPGRQPVVTSRVRGPAGRAKVFKFIRGQLAAGRQAYVVAPRVEEQIEDQVELERDGLPGSVEAIYRELRGGDLEGARVSLVHGRLESDEKARVMADFAEGQTQVLVSTTVIEVGVDVPAATLMVIYQAESFGLAQLHQLRGRIARGRHQGYCFLFSESDRPDVTGRMEVLEQTADGFRIAEADFLSRGPGDVLGLRQSGAVPLRLADFRRDVELTRRTQELARELVESGEFDAPEFAALKRRVLERFTMATELGQGG